MYTSFGSSTNSEVPRSGRTFTRFMFAGTKRECTYSLNFIICTVPTVTSGRRRKRLNRLIRNRRPKRSLIISRVGSRPRTMRSWLVKS